MQYFPLYAIRLTIHSVPCGMGCIFIFLWVIKTKTHLLSTLLYSRVMTQVGTLDHNFSADRIVTTSMGKVRNARAIALQAHGRIFTAGTAEVATLDFAVARYHPDGTLDARFSGPCGCLW
jgi:hypothetical protein